MPRRTATTRTTAPKPLTFAKRKALATEQLLRSIGAVDKDAATTSALEIVAEWLKWDAEMSQRVRERYAELEALNKKKEKPAPRPMPVPIAGPDLDHFNPYAKPDPYKLLEWYGHDQFRAVIAGATPPVLAELVAAVQVREPGTQPAGRKGKKAMVDYVVERVAGQGY